MKNWILLFFCIQFLQIKGQDSLKSYAKFDTNYVWYTDLGFSSGPASIKANYLENQDKIRFKNNTNLIFGIGFSYKWFALRLGISMGRVRPVSKFGQTQYYDLGFDFSYKKMFWDFDLHWYAGYAIKNAYKWNDTITPLQANLIRNDVNTASLSINNWYFFNKNFRMQAFRGKTAHYIKDEKSFYLKSTMNVHGIGSSQDLVPFELQDSTIDMVGSNFYTAFDFGVIPGYAYVKRMNDLQFGAMLGAGGVIQTKFYENKDQTRGFLGLAPRFDLKLIGGYNTERHFVMFVSDFDFKSIRFRELVYRQAFYNIKLVAGIRLHRKNKKVEHSEKK